MTTWLLYYINIIKKTASKSHGKNQCNLVHVQIEIIYRMWSDSDSQDRGRAWSLIPDAQLDGQSDWFSMN